MTSLTLNDFTRLADQASSQDTTFLKIRGGNLSETGRLGNFFTTQETRLSTTSAFVGALRKEYGDHIADMIHYDPALRNRMNAGRPLTARLVRDMVGMADEAKTHINATNRKVVLAFLSGEDPVGGLCDHYGVTSPYERSLLRATVHNFLMDKADRGGFHPQILSPDALKENVGKAFTDYTGFPPCLRDILYASCPGALQDKLRLANLGLGRPRGEDAVGLEIKRALGELNAMRRIQPDGDILPETVYEALFKESPPAGLDAGAIIEAVRTRCEQDENAILALFPKAKTVMESWAPYMPWDRFASLMERPGTVTLADMAGFAEARWNAADGSRENAVRYLALDLSRRGGHASRQPASATPPTINFHFNESDGDRTTETITVGPTTDFAFADDQDKANYLSFKHNSMADTLEAFSRGLWGGPGATEKQLTSILYCMTQRALIPLRNGAAALAGTGFNEHANVSINLSRLRDGSIRVDYASPQDMRDSQGHFRMSLVIPPDGAMTMTEFQLDPPKDIREQRGIEARKARQSEAGALCNLDDASPNGLFAHIQNRALALLPNADIVSKPWSLLARGIADSLESAMEKSDEPLTQDQKLQIRQDGVDAFFNKLESAMDMIPAERRADCLRFCLEVAGDTPDARLANDISLLYMPEAVDRAFTGMLTAKSGDEVLSLLYELGDELREDTYDNGSLNTRYNANDFLTMLGLGMRMGARDYLERNGMSPKEFAAIIAQPGPFRDALYTLGLTVRDEAEQTNRNMANATLQWFVNGMRNILPDNILNGLIGTPPMREGDLSLARQREILGGAYVARGAGVALPELAALNELLARDMPAMENLIRARAEEDLLKGPLTGPDSRSRTPQGLSSLFAGDYGRCGVFVNGRYYNSNEASVGSSEDDFIKCFPDRRTAGLLSNLAAQNLPGLLYAAVMEGASKETRELMLDKAQFGFRPFGVPEGPLNVRIETLDAARGRYRLIGLQGIYAQKDNPAIERSLYEITVDVNLGAPGVNEDSNTPSVENVRADFLIRGREVVPGEA